jgi:protein-disulfide isomerase
MQNRNVIIGALIGLALVVAGGVYGLMGSSATKPTTETAPAAGSNASQTAAASTPAATTTAAATSKPTDTAEPAPKPDANGCTPIGKYTLTPRDIVMGSSDAPITIIEYASMTCPHCAHVHETVLPKVKQDYIDKGLVRFVFREFPLDQLALAASVLTRCVSKDAYHPFLSTLFAQQRTWALSEDVRGSLKEISQRAGLTGAAFDACLQNRVEAEAVIKARDEGLKDYCVGGTPTTIMNGRVLAGQDAQDFTKLDVVLRTELQKLGKLPAGMTPPPVSGPAAPAPATPAPATPAPDASSSAPATP